MVKPCVNNLWLAIRKNSQDDQTCRPSVVMVTLNAFVFSLFESVLPRSSWNVVQVAVLSEFVVMQNTRRAKNFSCN